ncbi:MAG: selenocysteine-specific translation elongation factor [Gaiellaceae bacterium MAG52_C11]|nr:selenocysteine-specific translation elongation factor [Candidatus Gaiellasilicea maunaloa]
MPLTVGTAGHVDHGKTWLVRALTGKDTDRLPEEQARGISIDLGYAPLELADGRRLSLIDVPGHERFVRNMVAGATGIDLFLLVLDAAEGARAQTHEHLAILALLGIEQGVVAVTKADAVDPETLELALLEARELVPGAEVVAVSAKTGAGIDELRAALGRASDFVFQKHNLELPPRLYVDRVFTLAGIGTVVTGTLRSGSIAAGDVLRAEPRGLDVRVRSVQVHDNPVEHAEAGQRVALALPGIERRRLRRGDALVAAGAYPTSFRLDVVLEELEPIADGARLLVHHGTATVLGRVVRAGERFAQLRLAAPVVAARGDRVVLREATTVGGGRILDPAPPRHSDLDRFERSERGEETIHGPVLRHGEWRYADAWLAELEAELAARIEAADPLDPGVDAPTEPWARDVLSRLPFERRGSRLYLIGAGASLGSRSVEAAAIEAELAAAEPGAVKLDDRELARFLEGAGRLVRLGDGYAISTGAYARARALVVEECTGAGRIALARFRDLAGCGRRDAQLLLERLDADGVTRRVGDERVLRRRG